MLCIKAKDLYKVKFKRYLPWHETNVFSSCVKMVIRARHGGFESFQPVLFVGQCPDFALASIGGKENCGKISKVVEFLKQLQIFLKGKKREIAVWWCTVLIRWQYIGGSRWH